MDFSLQLLSGLIASSPQLTAAVVGMVIAALLWQRCTKAAVLLLIASLLESIVLIASCWYHYFYFLEAVASHSHSVKELSLGTTVVTMTANLLQAIVFGLLIWAIATDRRHASPPPVPSER
ncbi:hypothetical protein [Dyella sp. 20L07]|uniref:hypothetical protein n=1 Tax=Dyella sp. 20L07 TaxID=3384240 RepID=UPI003D2D2AC4